MASSLVLRLCLSAACAAATLVATHVFAKPTPPRLQRWAVVSSKSLQDSGLHDLVETHLKSVPGVTLVAREDLTPALKDQKLAAALGHQDQDQRRKLGQLVKADVLVLLAESTEGKSGLRVVLAETRYGARLRGGTFPLQAGQDKLAAAMVGELLKAVRIQHDPGLQRVFAVSPFLSKALIQDFDHLQTGLAQVLSNRLAADPGSAVLELEEARHLSKEFARAGDKLEERPVALYVEGDFEVTDARVRITLTLKNGERTLKTLKSPALPLNDVGKYMTQDAAADILKTALAEPHKAPSLDQQVALLTRRADAFARLGHLEQSVGLREAALLIDPNQHQQRRFVFDEYSGLLDVRRIPGLALEDHKPSNPQYRALLSKHLSYWKTRYAHYCTILQTQKLDLEEAVKLSNSMLQYVPAQVVHTYPKEAEAVRLHFLKEVFPKIGKIPSSSPHASTQLSHWEGWRALSMMATRRFDGGPLRRDDLDLLNEMLLKVLPDKTPLSSAMYFFLQQRPEDLRSERLRPGHFTEKDYLEFLDRLKKSDRKTAQMYGRYGWVYYQWLQARTVGKLPGQDVLTEAAALLKVFPHDNDYVHVGVRDLHYYIDKELNPEKYKVKEAPPVAVKPPPPPTTGALTYLPIEIKVKKLDGKIVPFKGQRWRNYHGWGSLMHMIPGEDGLDVFWNNGAIAFMREKGLFEEIFVTPDPIFDDVKWDGEHVWIATRKDGLWIVNRAGKVVTKVGPKQGLPPTEHAILLQPLAPGKMCAVGSFGDIGRTWCALITRADQDVKVNVFHRCTRAWTSADEKKEKEFSADPGIVFKPCWIHLYQRGKGQDPLLLIGRHAATYEAQQHPLTINAKTLEVGVADFHTYFAERCKSDGYFSKNGTLLEAGSFGTHVLQPRPADPQRFQKFAVTNNGMVQPHILPHQGKLYLAGGMWFEIDPDTLTERKLTPQRLANQFESLHCHGVSTHYGLIGWNDGNRDAGAFYQITVAPAKAK